MLLRSHFDKEWLNVCKFFSAGQGGGGIRSVLDMKMQIMTAFVVLAIAFQTETICATNCLQPSKNRKLISANTFPSPNASVGFGCFKRQRKREREKKKNLIDNGLSSTLFSLGAASFRYADIFSTLRLLQVCCYACALEGASGSVAHVVAGLKWSDFQETDSWKLRHYCIKHVLSEGEIDADIRLKFI